MILQLIRSPKINFGDFFVNCYHRLGTLVLYCFLLKSPKKDNITTLDMLAPESA
jgi:hypothetical protein